MCRTSLTPPRSHPDTSRNPAGTLTRESVSAALAQGLTAEDIIGHLRSHAHPQVARRFPVLPETVSDQVRLWEADVFRVRDSSATLYQIVEGREFFDACLAQALALGAVLYSNSDDMFFIAQRAAHEQLKTVIKELKARLLPAAS